MVINCLPVTLQHHLNVSIGKHSMNIDYAVSLPLSALDDYLTIE